MKLYELTSEERKLNDLFLSSIDEETGEIKECETFEELQKEFQNALAIKSTGLIKSISQAESDIDTVKKEIDRLSCLKKKMENELISFKRYIIVNMNAMELKKIETPLGKLSIRQTTATDITDESLIPKKFMKEKITYTPSKTDIKKALEQGEDVQGARLIINTSLVVK